MVKFSDEYIARFDERVICECCGKQMRLGERAVAFSDIVCVPCAKNGYRDKEVRKYANYNRTSSR